MTTAKTMADEALFPMLSAFHSISGQRLQAVWEICREGCLEELVLDFGSNALVVNANENDDSIELRVLVAIDSNRVGAVNVGNRDPWDRFIHSLKFDS